MRLEPHSSVYLHLFLILCLFFIFYFFLFHQFITRGAEAGRGKYIVPT